MLSNAYFLAKFRFGTAENEPAKNLQKFCKIWQKLLIGSFADPNRRKTKHRPKEAPKPLGAAAAAKVEKLEAMDLRQHVESLPELKGSIGEGPNHSNFSDRSSVRILSKFKNFR